MSLCSSNFLQSLDRRGYTQAVSLAGFRAVLPKRSSRFESRRKSCKFADSTQVDYYEAPVCGRKKVQALKQVIKRSEKALHALSLELGSGADVSTIVPELKGVNTELLQAVKLILSELESSSSSSSCSSDSEGDEPAVAKSRASKAAVASLPSTSFPRSNSTLHGAVDSHLNPVSVSGKIFVCQGSACKKRGADDILESFSQAARKKPDIQLIPCKCLGKCKQGPAVRLKNMQQQGSALHLDVQPLEAVMLLDSYFSKDVDQEFEQLGVTAPTS